MLKKKDALVGTKIIFNNQLKLYRGFGETENTKDISGFWDINDNMIDNRAGENYPLIKPNCTATITFSPFKLKNGGTVIGLLLSDGEKEKNEIASIFFWCDVYYNAKIA